MDAIPPTATPPARSAPPSGRLTDRTSAGAAPVGAPRLAPEETPTAFRRLAWVTVGVTYALVVLGGVVRVTGSGMGCGDDWPLCHGRLIPPLDLPTLIEYGHRLAASLAGVLVVALAVLAWTRHRRDRRLRRPAGAALAVLATQVLLGAAAVKLRLPPSVVVVHLAVAMILLGLLVATALGASPRAAAPSPAVRRLALLSAGLAFGTVVIGALVANLGAGAACAGFPLCNGTWLPAGGPLVHLHVLHRLAAFALVFALAVTALVACREPRARPVGRWALAAMAAAAAQVVVAAVMVLGHLPSGWRAGHMALGSLLWALVAGMAARAADRPASVTDVDVASARPRRVATPALALPRTAGRR